MENLKNFIKEIPLFGGLLDCKIKDHWLAMQEVFVNFAFSTVPISFLAATIWLKSELGFWEAVDKNITNGELLLYTAAILGPIFFMALNDPPGAKKFPSKLAHFICIAFILMASVLCFSLQRSELLLAGNRVYYASIFLFLFSWSLQYLATVYKNQRVPKLSNETFKKIERGFLEGFRAHRKNQ